MPKTTKIATCPNCGKHCGLDIWNTITATLEPDARLALLNGQLFIHTCPDCDTPNRMDYSTIYNDPERGFMINYVNNQNDYNEGIRMLNGLMDPENSDENSLARSYIYRMVTSQNALREKVLIFENGLDDRIIEMVKVLLLIDMHKKMPDYKFTEILFSLTPEGGFELHLLGDPIYSAHPDRSLYDKLSADMKELLEEGKNDALIIDCNWALEMLKRQEDEGAQPKTEE